MHSVNQVVEGEETAFVNSLTWIHVRSCRVGLLYCGRRCVEQEVEVVFALSRKQLGRVYGFKKRVSAVAVLELNGIHDQHRQLVRLAAAGREAWQQREREAETRVREGGAAGGGLGPGGGVEVVGEDRDGEQSSSGEEDEGEDGEEGEEGCGGGRGGGGALQGREGEGGGGVGVEAGAGRRLNAAAPSFVPHFSKAG